MYAIIEDSGQQFKVSEGDVVLVDLRGGDAEKIEFDRVLMVADDQAVRVGTPLLPGAKVLAEVLRAKVGARKIRVSKYKRRKGYRKVIDHRQKHIEVRITRIVA